MKSATHPSARSPRLHALLERAERIPSWLRFGCFATVLCAIGYLSLSDSVGASYTKPIVLVMNFVSALVPGSGLNPVGAVDLPVGIDTLGHFAIWGGVGFMTSLFIPNAVARFNALSILWALSAIIEVGQKYFSFSRAAQLSDLLANGAGLAVGSLIGATIVAWGHSRTKHRHGFAELGN